MKYLKFFVQLAAAVLAAVVPAVSVEVMDFTDIINVITLGAGAIMVFNASNAVPGWDKAKLVASAVSAGAVVLVSVVENGIDTGEWIQIVLAVLGALGVYVAPNKNRYGLAG